MSSRRKVTLNLKQCRAQLTGMMKPVGRAPTENEVHLCETRARELFMLGTLLDDAVTSAAEEIVRPLLLDHEISKRAQRRAQVQADVAKAVEKNLQPPPRLQASLGDLLAAKGAKL